MNAVDADSIRRYRLVAHHLDRWNEPARIPELAGACGLQNTPPGAWETDLFNRVHDCSLVVLNDLLYSRKSLLQAWSLRGVPLVFPVADSDAFLTALVPRNDESWIYTNGIGLALDCLQLPFELLLDLLRQLMPRLDRETITSKSTLDQTLADWMLPLLPPDRRDLWNGPSMYGAPAKQGKTGRHGGSGTRGETGQPDEVASNGSPGRQTVGGAVVSFLLRPCAFQGLVVFGERIGMSPTFTSYTRWLGQTIDQVAGAVAANKASDTPQERGAGTAADGANAVPAVPAAPDSLAAIDSPDSPDAIDSPAANAATDAIAADTAAGRKLARKFVHCYGPTTVAAFAEWLGSSERQARRLWASIADELEPVGSEAFIMAEDQALLIAPPAPQREWILLGAHDPYLDPRGRTLLLPDRRRHRLVWKTTANPGAILRNGEIVGIWTSRQKRSGMEIRATLWADEPAAQRQIRELAEAYAAFRQRRLLKVELSAVGF